MTILASELKSSLSNKIKVHIHRNCFNLDKTIVSYLGRKCNKRGGLLGKVGLSDNKSKSGDFKQLKR